MHTSDSSHHLDVLEDLPDELAILNRHWVSSERNPLLRVQPFKFLYVLWTLFAAFLIIIPVSFIYYAPRWNRPRQSWPLSRCVRVSFTRWVQGLVARCELDHLGRDLSIIPDPAILSCSRHVFLPALPPHLLTGFPLLSLQHLERTRGSWAAPHEPFLSSLDRLVDRVSGKPSRLAGGVLRAKRRAWKKGMLPWEKAPDQQERVPAFWFHKDGVETIGEDEIVGLNFHGGAYVAGTALESDGTANIPKQILASTPIHHILSVDYRLAHCNPFPCSLIDGIAAYHYLITTEGIPPERIVIIGDSAGGHLALALTRYLRDEGEKLGMGMPAGMVCFSPWADMTFSIMGAPNSSGSTNRYSDIIHDNLPPYAVSLALRAIPRSSLSSPYISPCALHLPRSSSGLTSFEGFPPSFIVAGEAERLRDEIRELVVRMRMAVGDGVAGGECEYLEEEGAVHDYPIFAWQRRESRRAMRRLDRWVRRVVLARVKERSGAVLGDRLASVASSRGVSPARGQEDWEEEEGYVETMLELGGEALEMFGKGTVASSDLEQGEEEKEQVVQKRSSWGRLRAV